MESKRYRPRKVNTTEDEIMKSFEKKIRSGAYDQPSPLSEERRGVLNQELEDLAQLFSDSGNEWYVAGGSALELFNGGLKRDHQDWDISILRSDVPAFFEYSVSLGYEYFDVHGGRISSADQLIEQRENGFVMKSDPTKTQAPGFELMFLDVNEADNILFSHDDTLSFPREFYQSCQAATAHGVFVPLTPPEVQLLYKITEGRHKDFIDVQEHLAEISPEKKQRLVGFLNELNLDFIVSGVKVNDLDTFIDTAKNDESFHERAINEVLSHVKEDYHKFEVTLAKIYEIAANVKQDDFLDALVREFGDRAQQWDLGDLETMKQALFHETVSLQEFQSRFPITQHLEKRITAYVSHVPRWEVQAPHDKEPAS